MRRLAAGAVGLLALLALVLAWPRGADAERIEGARLYAAHCASCHGAHLEGQKDWDRPGADGLLPAPPHDASGHSWQHSDAELYDLIAHSLANVAPRGYRTAMPAFAATLKPAEITAVIAFLKSTWPPGIRAYQASLASGTPDYASLGPDWSFPPTCRPLARPAPPGG